MQQTASLITPDIDLDAPGIRSGALRLPYSHDRSAYGFIPIPVTVAKNGDGPTVLLTGGNHGDEYEGPIALRRLIARLDLSRINGRLIIIPALNAPAYLAGSRTSPIDKGNLNRLFPGKRNGTPTEMIAHYVESVLFPMCDYVFDAHSGGKSLDYIPVLFLGTGGEGADMAHLEELAALFAADHQLVMDMLGEDRTIGAAAARNKVHFLTGEFGGAGSVNIDGVATLDNGLRSLLDGLGVLRDEAIRDWRARRPPAKRYRMSGARDYIFASRPGMFEPAFRLGEMVEDGQLAGRIHDVDDPTATPVEIRFRASGLAACIRTHSLVEAGDCLGHLIEPVD